MEDMQRIQRHDSDHLAAKIDAIAKASGIADAPGGAGSGADASKGAEASPAASGIGAATGEMVPAELYASVRRQRDLVRE